MRSLRIGRGRGNDIIIKDGTVSRQHAELRLTDSGDITLVDLGSTNGTCVRESGQWIEIEQASVEAGERILLGEVMTSVNALMERVQAGPAVELPPDAARRVRTEPALPASERPETLPEAELVVPPRAHRADPDLDVTHAPWPASRRQRLAGAGSAEAAEMDSPAQETRGEAPPRYDPSQYDPPPLDPPPLGSPRIEDRPAAVRPSQELPATRRQNGLAPGGPVTARPVTRSRKQARAERKEKRGIGRRLMRFAATAAVATLLGAAAAFGYFWFDDVAGGADASRGSAERNAAATGAEEGDRENAGEQQAEDRGATDRRRQASSTGEMPRPVMTEASGNPRWQQRLGSAGDEVFASAVPGSGGLFAAGTLDMPGGQRFWIARFSERGELAWQQALELDGPASAASIFPTDDGGAIAVGHVEIGEDRRAPLMVRFDRTGRIVWQRRLDQLHSGVATFITGVPGGYVVSAAVTQQAGANAAARVVKIDEQGRVLWTRNFTDGITWPSSMRRARDGGVVVAGSHKNAPDERFALWAARIDSRGALHWVKRFPHEGGEDGAAYVRRAAGDEYIVATTHTGPNGGVNARLVRLNGEGNVIWQHVNDTPEAERVSGLILVRDGMIVSGSTENGSQGGRDLWVARINTDGALAWQRRFGGAADDWATDIRQLSNRDLLVSGVSASDGAGGRDALLLRLDSRGQISE